MEGNRKQRRIAEMEIKFRGEIKIIFSKTKKMRKKLIIAKIKIKKSTTIWKERKLIRM